MRRWINLVIAAGLVAGGAVGAGTATAATPAKKWPSTLRAQQHLRPGQRLESANGRFHAAVAPDGRLAVRTAASRLVWATPKTGAGASLYLATRGQLVLTVAGRTRWVSGTAGAGRAAALTMRGDGVLTLTVKGASVWSSAALNACPKTRGKTVVVDLSQQRARMCLSGEQARTTPVTTGATASGDGTPTGTWHVQARIRNTTLYPAAGGAYPVKYWMPYDGAYGLHDSSWQRFAYGSSLYRTRGSHGCVHFPGAMMSWLFGWAPVGTAVAIHR
jgi:hypothetical protein